MYACVCICLRLYVRMYDVDFIYECIYLDIVLKNERALVFIW